MSTPTVTEVQEEADASHREAAEKFFSESNKTEVTPPTKTPVAAATPAANAAPDPAASIIKPKAATPPAQAVTTSPDDLTKDIDALTPPDEKSKNRADWDKLKTGAKETRVKLYETEQKLSAADKRLAELTKTGPIDEATKSRLTQLEQDNKKYSDRLKVLDLRSHPEFQQKFVTPQIAAKTAMADLLKAEEVPTNIDELLSLKGRKFNEGVSEVLEKLTPFGRVRFQSQLDSLIQAQLGAEKALSEADEFLKTANQNVGARSRAVFDEVGVQFKETHLPQTIDDKTSAEDRPALEAYNAALAEAAKKAERYALGQIDEPTAAAMAHKAAHYDLMVEHGIPRISAIYQKAMGAQAARIQELEKQVAEMTAAKPKISGGSGTPGEEAPEGSETHLQAAHKYFPSR